MNDRIQEIKNRHDYDKALYAPKVLMSPPYKDRAYLLSEVERLQEENKAMKEALEWYSNMSKVCESEHLDGGKRARAALSHLKGE